MIVIKFGGHAMSDKNGDFAQTVKTAISKGVEIVIVHGGGPQIDKVLEQAGITSEFVGGFRKTTPEIFAVVESVLVDHLLHIIFRVLVSVRKQCLDAGVTP